jgi:hypothetical protein
LLATLLLPENFLLMGHFSLLWESFYLYFNIFWILTDFDSLPILALIWSDSTVLSAWTCGSQSLASKYEAGTKNFISLIILYFIGESVFWLCSLSWVLYELSFSKSIYSILSSFTFFWVMRLFSQMKLSIWTIVNNCWSHPGTYEGILNMLS